MARQTRKRRDGLLPTLSASPTMSHADSPLEEKDIRVAASTSLPSLTPTAVHSTTCRSISRRPWRRRITPWKSIISHWYEGSGTEADPFIVTWLPNGEENEDPFDLNDRVKWLCLLMAGFTTMSVSMSSSIYSAAVFDIRTELPGSDIDYILCECAFVGPRSLSVTSLVVMGFALGPLVWGPASEVLGRRTVHIISYIPFILFSAACCLAQTLPALLVLRFFTGLFGSSATVNGG